MKLNCDEVAFQVHPAKKPKQTIQKVTDLVKGVSRAEITGLLLGLRMILIVSTRRALGTQEGSYGAGEPEHHKE